MQVPVLIFVPTAEKKNITQIDHTISDASGLWNWGNSAKYTYRSGRLARPLTENENGPHFSTTGAASFF